MTPTLNQEFCIDTISKDNKIIIHHKVTARVLCILDKQEPSAGGQHYPAMQLQGLIGMGSIGGSMHLPSKSSLTFNHILSCLQGELQKSCKIGAELHSLNSSMNEIHDALSGNVVSHLAVSLRLSDLLT